MKNKVKKITIILLIILILLFVILTVSKIVIIKNIVRNVEANFGDKDNFYYSHNFYTDKNLYVERDYIDKDSHRSLHINYEVDFDSDEKAEMKLLDCSTFDGEYYKSYDIDSEGKAYLTDSVKDSNDDNDIYNPMVDNVKNLFSLKNMFKCSITSEKVRGIDCYKVKFFSKEFSDESVVYVDKETGAIVRIVSREGNVNDYYYKFDTVTDETFKIFEEAESKTENN